MDSAVALKGKAKAAYQRKYMRPYMEGYRGHGPDADLLRSLGFEVAEDHRQRKPAFTDLDTDVLRLALAGHLDQEIQELLDLPEEALRKHLEQIAEYLAPTPASRSVEECIPFNEAIR